MTELQRVAAIQAEVPGWSDAKQWGFFREMLRARDEAAPDPFRVLMLGVYMGRDISILASVARAIEYRGAIEVVGVDKFSDTPCADWPKHLLQSSWERAGFGKAPELPRAAANIAKFTGSQAPLIEPSIEENRAAIQSPDWPSFSVELLRADAQEYLRSTTGHFDLVYLDTSHDYETVRDQLRLAERVCALGATVAGDDYSDANGWGVKRAVTEILPGHRVFAGWIWHAPASSLPSVISTQ